MALSPDAAALFAYLPASYGTDPATDVDPIVARWLEAEAAELGKVRGVLEALRATTIPSTADDTVRSLQRWEKVMGLPVAPAGVTVTQRRANLISAILARNVAYGRDWTAAISALIGVPGWSVEGNTPGPNQLTIHVPYSSTSFAAGQLRLRARRITPAHIEIIFDFAGGFIVGFSDVGDTI